MIHDGAPIDGGPFGISGRDALQTFKRASKEQVRAGSSMGKRQETPDTLLQQKRKPAWDRLFLQVQYRLVRRGSSRQTRYFLERSENVCGHADGQMLNCRGRTGA